MAKLHIRKLGDEALRKVCRPVDNITPVAVTLWTLLCGGLGVLPLLDFPHYLTVLQTPGAWLPALGLILLSTIAPILLYTLGLSGLSNGTASLLATLEPVVAALIGVFFFREALTLTQLLGISAPPGFIVVSCDKVIICNNNLL